MSLMRPAAPLIIDTADFGQAKCRAINDTNSLFALPSTGGDFSWASHGPFSTSSRLLTRAFGFTFTWMTFIIRLNAGRILTADDTDNTDGPREHLTTVSFF